MDDLDDVGTMDADVAVGVVPILAYGVEEVWGGKPCWFIQRG